MTKYASEPCMGQPSHPCTGARSINAPANTSSGSCALTMYWPASTISEIRRSTHRLASRYASSGLSPYVR